MPFGAKHRGRQLIVEEILKICASKGAFLLQTTAT